MEISRVILIGKIQESYSFSPPSVGKLAFLLIQMNNTASFHKLMGQCGQIPLVGSSWHCVDELYVGYLINLRNTSVSHGFYHPHFTDEDPEVLRLAYVTWLRSCR